jgi:hypothetical protein
MTMMRLRLFFLGPSWRARATPALSRTSLFNRSDRRGSQRIWLGPQYNYLGSRLCRSGGATCCGSGQPAARMARTCLHFGRVCGDIWDDAFVGLTVIGGWETAGPVGGGLSTWPSLGWGGFGTGRLDPRCSTLDHQPAGCYRRAYICITNAVL